MKLFKMIFVLFLCFITASFLTTPVSAATASEIGQRISSDTEIISRLLTHFNNLQNTEEDIASVLNETKEFQSHFQESASYYSNLAASETDGSAKELLTKWSNNSKLVSDDAGVLLNKVENGEETEINEAQKKLYTDSIEERDKLIGEYNNHFNLVDYGDTFFWLLVVTGIISLVLFIWSRGNPVLPSEKLSKELKQGLFKSSLWPFGGALITYVGQAYSSPGGEFYIFWGPIIFGFYQFVKGLYNYQRYAKPILELAKKEEQHKLDELLTSESFKKEDLKRKLDEIQAIEYSSIGAKQDHNDHDDNIATCHNCGRQFLSSKTHCPYCKVPLAKLEVK